MPEPVRVPVETALQMCHYTKGKGFYAKQMGNHVFLAIRNDTPQEKQWRFVVHSAYIKRRDDGTTPIWTSVKIPDVPIFPEEIYTMESVSMPTIGSKANVNPDTSVFNSKALLESLL